MDPHAQFEIREYAEAMYDIIKEIVPDTCKAFKDYHLNSITLSSIEIEAFKSSNLLLLKNKKELNEYKKKLEKLGIEIV